MPWPRRARVPYIHGIYLLLWMAVAVSGDVQCECGDSEFVEFQCITAPGAERNAVCRSCEDFCGVGGACRGGGRNDCRSCGPLRSRGVLVNSFLEDEGPVTERGWSHCTDDDDSNDSDCHLIGDGHGVCRRCSECSDNQYLLSACETHSDTVCRDRVTLPNVMISSEGDSHSSKQVTLRLSQRQLRATDVPSNFHGDYYIVYAVSEPDSDDSLLRLPSCSGTSPTERRQTHTFDISETLSVAAMACPLDNDNSPWLPSGISEQLVALRPVCECKPDEWVVDSCDEAEGKSVRCRKCDEACGEGGACVGPNPDDCTACGIDQARGAEMFFVPGQEGDGRGECRACGEACAEGHFMSSPCTESSAVQCQRCSTCEDGEYAFIECDRRSNQDTVCVGGQRLPSPQLQPDGPFLLAEGAQKVSLQLSAPDGAYLLYTISPDMEERLQRACYSGQLQQQFAHKLRSTADRERDTPHSITLTFAPGRTSLMAVACPIDNAAVRRPPSDVMTKEVLVTAPYIQQQSGSEAAVRGDVEISGQVDRLGSTTASASGRFGSLLRYALLNSAVSDAMVFVSEQESSERSTGESGAESTVAASQQVPRRSMLQSAHAAAFPPAKRGIPHSAFVLRFEVHTVAPNALRVRDIVSSQLEPDGGVSLGMAVEGLRLRSLAEPSVVCSLAESRPCEVSPGRFGECGLEESPSGDGAMCIQRAPATLLSPGGSCAPPCGALDDFVNECRACACEDGGCVAAVEAGISDAPADSDNRVAPGWIVFGVWICLAAVVLVAWLYITKYRQSELQLAHIVSHLDKVVLGIGQILTRATKQPCRPTSEEVSLRQAEVQDAQAIVFQSFNPAYRASSGGSSGTTQRLTEEEHVNLDDITDPDQRVQMTGFLNALAGKPRETESTRMATAFDAECKSTEPNTGPTQQTHRQLSEPAVPATVVSTHSPSLPPRMRSPPRQMRSVAKVEKRQSSEANETDSVWDNAANEITSAREVRRSITNDYEPSKGSV